MFKPRFAIRKGVTDMISPELESKLQNIVAMEEIKNLIGKYANIVDARQWDEILDLFADDFIAETHEGKFKKNDMPEVFKRANVQWTRMYHQMMTPYIEVDGDKARGIWYIFGPFTATTPRGEVACWLQGKYDCDFVCENGEWKFERFGFTLNLLSPYDDGWLKTPLMES
jgi:hypothetical protein